VLAQHIVRDGRVDTWSVDDLFRVVRRAAPYADLSRRMFEGVLDMLSGRYRPMSSPSSGPHHVGPRARDDRRSPGRKRVATPMPARFPTAVCMVCSSPGAERPVRVGELDEEMVFETQVGETFTLGASTGAWKRFTHDRVLVSPAPGEPGKMPFWHGDQAGRPVELGIAIGKLFASSVECRAPRRSIVS